LTSYIDPLGSTFDT